MRKLNNKQKALIAIDATRMYLINDSKPMFTIASSLINYNDIVSINDYESINSDIERYADDIIISIYKEDN